MGINLQKEFESWPERDKPPFSNIKVIGCCEEHEKEGDFKWYRENTWKDFKEIMLSNSDTLNWQGIDLFQVSSLDMRVWRYYAKGILSGLYEIVSKASSFNDIPFEFWQWIEHSKGIDGVDFKKLASLSELSKKEAEDIVSLVKMIAQLKNDDEDYRKDVQNTLLFWESLMVFKNH